MAWAVALAAATPSGATTAADDAFAVVQRYYAAIDARDYRAAYRLWSGGDTLAALQAGYADTVAVRVTAPAGPCRIEGAAGSSYCEQQVKVDAVRRGGRHRRYRGSFTLRRINDVPGSSAADRQWHIVAAKLHPAA